MLRKKFLLMTSHMSLKYLFSQLGLNARQARWLAFLRKFDMEIKHIKGKESLITNALSRHYHQILSYTSISVKFNVEENIQEVMSQDPRYLEL